jgi:hypothetical protein
MSSGTGTERNGARVREILADAVMPAPVRVRESRGVAREVFLLQGRYVVKRYTCPARPRAARRPWSMEDAALRRLDGRGAPPPVGFVEEWGDAGLQATLVRGFVSGTPVAELDADLVTEMAATMAAIHGRGVTTEDAHRENFVRCAGGALAFIDFGKARVFHPWNPLLHAGIAFDLHRLYRAALDRDEALWRGFRAAYLDAVPFPAAAKRMIIALLAIERLRYRLVKGD